MDGARYPLNRWESGGPINLDFLVFSRVLLKMQARKVIQTRDVETRLHRTTFVVYGFLHEWIGILNGHGITSRHCSET